MWVSGKDGSWEGLSHHAKGCKGWHWQSPGDGQGAVARFFPQCRQALENGQLAMGSPQGSSLYQQV